MPGAGVSASTLTSGTARVRAVLFDLDGTLIDSAPDLAGAANDLRAAPDLPPMPFAELRPMVGSGARGMVATAFGVAPGNARFDTLRDQFLARYETRSLQDTRVSDAMAPWLAALAAAGLPWGIVTNKHTRYAEPVVRGLGLDNRAATVICGDTVARAKPHPDPLLEAARRLALAPQDCVYVGDDRRDAEAAQAAGMTALVAAWGYLGRGEDPATWGAQAILSAPADLLNWLGLP